MLALQLLCLSFDVHALLPDIAVPIEQRKQRFMQLLLPIAKEVNANIEGKRQRLLLLSQQDHLSEAQTIWLNSMARHYVPSMPEKQVNIKRLLEHIDVVPVSLIIAQAAIESAWGNSRFAREGNNFFGIWCFRQGCGLVPKRRAPNSVYEVRRFPSVTDSVRAYVDLLNRHPKYQQFRELRAKLRLKYKHKLPVQRLLVGLRHFSERRDDYIRSIRLVMRSNHLDKLD